MNEYQEQIQRIKEKLGKAKRKDFSYKVFGAESHKYKIGLPVSPEEVLEFERKYSIELPDCYKAFVLQIGNGGTGYSNSAAGPFYGIYPLGDNVDELIEVDVAKYIKNKCVVFPKMTNDYWFSLNKKIDENDDISDDEYNQELGIIFAGILPIGSQGCTYIHAIILDGEFKGRVVNIDMGRQKPHFSFENNFLDWYERWLDEIISGELIENSNWFGYNKGGTEDELTEQCTSTSDKEEQEDCLAGLLNKKKLKKKTLNQIERLLESDFGHKKMLIKLLCKSNYTKAKPYLIQLIKTDLLSVFQYIFWYAKDKSNEWEAIIKKNIDRINDAETFRFCTYILKEANSNFGDLIVPFTKMEDYKIRRLAFYSLGELKNKKDYVEVFIKGLNDKSNQVIHATLQALSDVKDRRLLKHYQNIAQQFPVEKDYILSNLNHRLADYELTNLKILTMDIDEFKD